jgi:hypothetical protein
MTCHDVLDLLGSLVSALKAYGANLPPIVHLSSLPGGLKPTPEAIDAYETTVSRFRDQSGKSVYRRLNDHFLDSLEAFEVGKLLSAIQPLLAVLDLLDAMQHDKEITVTPAEAKRLAEYRVTLNKLLPGNQPELEGAGRGMS